MIFIADFIACSTCFGQYYAHHQELESIIQIHHTDNLKTKGPNTTGSDHLYNTLELLMMGIILPKTCWACNKICNKFHLLHLVGILFPHNNDDARSKSLQIKLIKFMDFSMDMIGFHLACIQGPILSPKRSVKYQYIQYRRTVNLIGYKILFFIMLMLF